MFVRDVPIFVSQTCAFKILTADTPRNCISWVQYIPRFSHHPVVTGSNWYPVSSHPKKKHRNTLRGLFTFPFRRFFRRFAGVPIPSCFLFSVKTLSEIRSRDVLLAAVTCHLGQLIAMATRHCQNLPGMVGAWKHKSTHKNSLCDFSSHMAMSETPVPQVVYPKPNPSYLHHISPILPDHWFVWHQSQPPAGRTKVPALPSQPGGMQSGTAAGVTKLLVNQAKMEI